MVELFKAIKNANAKLMDKADNEKSKVQDEPVERKSVGNHKHIKVNRSGWISPQYHKSRQVALDNKILEENHLIGLLPGSLDSNYYKVLRTRIQQRMSENGWNTLMVTSAHPGEGKSITAINLSAMFAKEFHQTVMLVDADLRAQSIHRYMGYQSEKGLVDYLLGNADIRDIIVWPGIEKLTVISGGQTCDQGAEVLNSRRMRSLVAGMKHRYRDRYLFFDVPPLLESADAMVLAEFVDAIVVVVQEGKTPMPDIQKALSYIPKEKFLGFVMNHWSDTIPDYRPYPRDASGKGSKGTSVVNMMQSLGNKGSDVIRGLRRKKK